MIESTIVGVKLPEAGAVGVAETVAVGGEGEVLGEAVGVGVEVGVAEGVDSKAGPSAA